MVAGKGYASSTQYQSSTGHLSGHLSEIENIRIDFEISSGDKATLNQRVYDLTLGRVFLVRPDGSLRQIPCDRSGSFRERISRNSSRDCLRGNE